MPGCAAWQNQQEVVQFLTRLPKPTVSQSLKRAWDDSGNKEKPPKGKGKGKGKKGKGVDKKLFELPHGAHAKNNGLPNCFGFNLTTCKFKVNKKGRCGRGFHKCWFCGEDRPAYECPAAPSTAAP